MTATTIRVQMAQRKDTAANWTAANPILLSGEIGYETDTKKFKIGDGSTNWNSLAYLPIPDGSGNLTITGTLEIGSTGALKFEGSTADAFETTLAVTNPTADRTITLPNVTGTVITTGDTGTVTSSMLLDGTISNVDISTTAEIAVSKLADGSARQLLQTDAAGTGVEWTNNVDIPGTLDVTGAAVFDSAVTVQGNLTVNGTTTTIDTQNLIVEDKNVIIGQVTTPTDITADGGGITLKGTTDKTINWVDATDAWTLSEHVSIANGKEYRINGTKVLDGSSLGSGITSSSLTSVGTIGTGTWQGSTIGTGYGGTGQTSYSNGQLLIGKTDGTLAKAALTAGTGITITNGDGSISIASTATGTVTSVTASTPLASTGGTTPDISIQDGTTTQKGAVQLEDSTSSTSTTKAATPASVKSAYDLAAAALPLSGGTLTGALASTLGSASTPSITFTGDLNTGIYSPGADQVAVATNGTGRLFIDSSGRLLVGTSTARAAGGHTGRFQLEGTNYEEATASIAYNANDANGGYLHFIKTRTGNTVVQNGDLLGHIRFYGTDGSAPVAGVSIKAEVDGTPGANDMPGRLVLSTTADGTSSPTERLRITSAGLVGVGTSSPQHLLDCTSIGRFTGNTNSAASGSGIEIGYNAGSTTGFIQSYNRGSSTYLSTAVDGSDIQFKISGTERARIDTSGRLGIGTSSPSQKLDVADGDFVLRKTTGGDTSGVTSQVLRIGTQSGDLACFYAISAGAGGPSGRGGNLYIQTKANNGSPTDRLVITEGGLVGIGTTSPSTELHISRATAGRVITRLADPDGRTTELRSPDNVGNTAGVGTTTNHPFVFFQNNTEAARIDESKRLLVGTSTALPAYYNSTATWTGLFQVARSTQDAVANLSIWNGDASTYTTYGGAQIHLSACKSGTVGTHTSGALTNNDSIATINFNASDGTNFRNSARIEAVVDGGVSTGDVPGRLVFSTTADGASSPTERMRITSAGKVHFATATSGVDGVLINSPTSRVAGNFGSGGGLELNGFDSGTDGCRVFVAGSTRGDGRANRMEIVPGSNGLYLASGGTSWVSLSDERFKTSLIAIENGLDKVASLRAVTGRYIKDDKSVSRAFLIAQDVLQVLPEAVDSSKDSEGNTLPLGLQYTDTIPLLVAALKESKERIEQLEQRLTDAGIA